LPTTVILTGRPPAIWAGIFKTAGTPDWAAAVVAAAVVAAAVVAAAVVAATVVAAAVVGAAVVGAAVVGAAVVATAVVGAAVGVALSPQAPNSKLNDRVKRMSIEPNILLFITHFLLLWLTLL
jgi:hypothetical protein